MGNRKVIQTDDGWQVWKKNQLIASVDENDTLRALQRGEWITLCQVDNSNDILPALDSAGIR